MPRRESRSVWSAHRAARCALRARRQEAGIFAGRLLGRSAGLPPRRCHSSQSRNGSCGPIRLAIRWMREADSQADAGMRSGAADGRVAGSAPSTSRQETQSSSQSGVSSRGGGFGGRAHGFGFCSIQALTAGPGQVVLTKLRCGWTSRPAPCPARRGSGRSALACRPRSAGLPFRPCRRSRRASDSRPRSRSRPPGRRSRAARRRRRAGTRRGCRRCRRSAPSGRSGAPAGRGGGAPGSPRACGRRAARRTSGRRRRRAGPAAAECGGAAWRRPTRSAGRSRSPSPSDSSPTTGGYFAACVVGAPQILAACPFGTCPRACPSDTSRKTGQEARAPARTERARSGQLGSDSSLTPDASRKGDGGARDRVVRWERDGSSVDRGCGFGARGARQRRSRLRRLRPAGRRPRPSSPLASRAERAHRRECRCT